MFCIFSYKIVKNIEHQQSTVPVPTCCEKSLIYDNAKTAANNKELHKIYFLTLFIQGMEKFEIVFDIKQDMFNVSDLIEMNSAFLEEQIPEFLDSNQISRSIIHSNNPYINGFWTSSENLPCVLAKYCYECDHSDCADFTFECLKPYIYSE